MEENCTEIQSRRCDANVSGNIEKVLTNYVIIKQILRNLSWQDKLHLKNVCTTWCSAINTLRKEQLYPIDFCFEHGINQSAIFSNEPLAVLSFMNNRFLTTTITCNNKYVMCEPPCNEPHLALSVMHKYMSSPKECFIGVKASIVSYVPLPESRTKTNAVTCLSSRQFIGGVFLPIIPSVKFHIINLKDHSLMKQEFYSAIDTIVTDQIIKGVLVFVTDKHLLHSVEDIVFLNHIKDVQPDIPYAMGGCICEDTVCSSSDISDIVNSKTPVQSVSDNLISIGVFTVPKELDKNICNFDMYSLIIESCDWDKQKIQAAITQFAKRVPQFEHSVCLKLSCVGRDTKHKWEHEAFRAAFPKTRIVGCYGNGELGIDHPAKPIPEVTMSKRRRRYSGPQFGIIYSYSTVFVYMGWGKVTTNS